MPASVGVTIGSLTILQDAANEVRAKFPGASLNEILRYCALSVTVGTREARNRVFGNERAISDSEKVYAKIPDDEMELLKEHVRGGRTIAEIYREGLYQIAGESPTTARDQARMKRGPRKNPKENTDEPAT